MSVEQSRSILKVTGILSIIFSAFGLVLGLLAFAGGGLAASQADGAEGVAGGAVFLLLGVIVILGAAIGLVKGIFSVQAAKDISKIMPAWILAIIDLIFRGVTAVGQMTTGTLSGSNFFSVLINIGISVLIFMAADTIKKATGK